jgi:hypothetical protein
MDLIGFAVKLMLVIIVSAIIVSACGVDQPLSYSERLTIDGIECVAYKDPAINGISCDWPDS